MGETRIYLIGTGVIGGFHAQSVAALPDPSNVRLAAADPSEEARSRFQESYPEWQVVESAEAMLAEPSRPDDIVVVATPPSSHCDLACSALETGRNVLCEKPWAMNRKEAERMVAAAHKNDRIVGSCSCRFLGRLATEKVKEMLRSGQLGTPYRLNFINRAPRSRPGIEYQPETKWFLDSSKNGGGCLMDWGPYDFAVLSNLLSPVRVDVCGAWMANPVTAADPEGVVFDVEEHVGATLRYHQEDGNVVSVTYERSACVHGDGCHVTEVEGLKGSVRWDWSGFPEDANKMTFSYDRDGTLQTDEIEYKEEAPISPFHKALVFFYRQVKGEDVPTVINEQALFDFSCLQAVYDSARTGEQQTVVRGG
jgi:predicted dehydrogenase